MSAGVAWLGTGAGELRLTVHVQPGAKRSEIVGEHGDALKLRLLAPPVDGKANAALIAFLAATLDLPKAAISLKSGQTARRKILALATSATPSEVEKRLRAAFVA